jgi:hypothetical protein
MGHLTLLVITCLLFASTSDAHRILGLFPHPGHSHFQFFHPIMRALAEAGHEVTVVSEFPNKEPLENYNDELLTGDGNGLLNFVSLDVSFASIFIQNSMIKKSYCRTSNQRQRSLTCWSFSCFGTGATRHVVRRSARLPLRTFSTKVAASHSI